MQNYSARKPTKTKWSSTFLTAFSVIGLLSSSVASAVVNECSSAFVVGGIRERMIHNIIADRKGILPANAQLNFDEVFGGLGFSLFDIVQEARGRSRLVRREEFTDIRAREKSKLERLPRAPSDELLRKIEPILHPRYQDDGTVVVSFDNESFNDRFTYGVRTRFVKLYRDTAALVYRLEGLVESDLFISAKLADDPDLYATKGRPLTYFLTFEREIFDLQMRELERFWQIDKAGGLPGGELATEMLSDNPFWPKAGVAIAQSRANRSTPVEFKRYFKNELEDPLEILSPRASKDDYSIRQQLLLNALQTLPPGTTVQIHSHTRAHTIAYRRLGFKVSSELVDPKYNDAKVELLEAKSEEVIERISQILRRREASNEAH